MTTSRQRCFAEWSPPTVYRALRIGSKGKSKLDSRYRPSLEILETRRVLDSTVVFNEIMYNPLEESTPEWIELYNQNSVNMDLSDWRIDGGVEFTFPQGTVLEGGEYLVIAADTVAMTKVTGLEGTLGPFEGKLSNGGEEIELRNNTDRIMDALDYDDRGDWPVGPDGSGATLAKRNPHASTEPAANWTFSHEIGGTPGAENFLEPGSFKFTELLSDDAPARAFVPLDGMLKDSWIQPDFDDASWTHGFSAVGYDARTDYDRFLGLDLDNPPDGQLPIPMHNVNQTVYTRFLFDVTDDVSTFDTLTLKMRFEDGFVAYINGVEVAHANAPGRDGNDGLLSWFSGAAKSNSDSRAVQVREFDITEFRGAFVQGENVLAIHGLNKGVGGSSGDLLLLPEIVGGREVEPATSDAIILNEISPAGSEFWVEIANSGLTGFDVAGFLLRDGTSGQELQLSTQVVEAGGYAVVDASRLGLQPESEGPLFLYGPGRTHLIDAQRVETRIQGRSADLGGRWMFPDSATPGDVNAFSLHEDVVINEIMYHAPPQYATADTPPVYALTTLLSFDADEWRYNQAGNDLGADWYRTSHLPDNSTWFEGQGVIGFETSDLAAPILTELNKPSDNNPRFITFYFQKEFELTPEQLSAADAIHINHLIDDGAVFYLNGDELFRFNMPAGPFTSSTEASRSIRNAEMAGPVVIPKELLVAGTNTLSAEVHLSSPSSNDVVFGVELLAARETKPGVPGLPFVESEEEWIEIYNRNETTSFELTGWKLDDAIEFEFPEGTRIGPQEYLVVAKAPRALESKHVDSLPPGSVLGPFEASLSNSNERIQLIDASGNLADEVHYYDDGRWHEYADGMGASLELRDPYADNRRPEAWATSDDSGTLNRAQWNHYSYTRTLDPLVFDPVIHFHELHIGMLDAGEVLIDNMSVIEDPGGSDIEFLQNGDFESDQVGDPAGKWRIQGTHQDSHVITDPDDPNNKVLHLIAEGRSNYFGNHAETTFADRERAANGNTYRISFDARWVAGSPQLHTELYYKDAALTHIVQPPEKVGTPGARNSRFEDNMGPTFADLHHEPAIPKESQPVTVSVKPHDADGLGLVTLVWSADGGDFVRSEMNADSTGEYSATIPGRDDGDVVQFYVEATDSQGAVSLYPPAGPDSRALYKVDADFRIDPLRHDLRIIMLDDEARDLHAVTEYIDNDLTGSTVIYRGREIFYDVGTRLKGSMFSRNDPNRAGVKVRFHPDQLFRGVQETITFDRANPREVQVKHLIRQAGMLGGMYDDVVNFIPPRGTGSGPTNMQMARFGNVFLDSQFENGSDGELYKFEGIRVMTSTSDRSDPESLKIYQPIGWVAQFDIADLGDDKELYRWPFLKSNNRARDNFEPMIAVAKAMSLEGEELEEQFAKVADVDQWMQTFAMMSLAGIADVYSQGNPHNLSFYVPPGGKMLTFPWDWDFTFDRGAQSPLYGNKNIRKVIERPVNQRIFLGHMLSMINSVFNVDYMSPWLDHYGDMLGVGYAGNRNYIRQRGEFVLSRLPEQKPFAITSNGGETFTTTRTSFGLEGSGWIDIREIRLQGNDTEPLAVRWTGIDTWQADFPLASGPNELVLEAYDSQGNLVGSDSVTIISTPQTQPGDVLISEVHYHNTKSPPLGSAGPEEFEYVELLNRSLENIDLTGWRLMGEVEFQFGQDHVLAPGETFVVLPFGPDDAVRRVSLELIYEINSRDHNLIGPFTKQLGDDGGVLRLERPLTEGPGGQFRLVDEVLYDVIEPWPVQANGGGSSLTRIVAANGTRPSTWSAEPPSLGSAELRSVQVLGDSNGDGRFDQLDIVLTLQGGKYLSGQTASLADGDWNGDGLFDQNDIVTVLQANTYEPTGRMQTLSPPALSKPREADVDRLFAEI